MNPPDLWTRRPDPGEYDASYAGYVSCVPDGNLLEFLGAQPAVARARLGNLSPPAADHRYAPAKWTRREVLGHVVDTEWVFAYRAIRFARNDAEPLAGVDQNVLMRGARFALRSMGDLLEEWAHLRAAQTLQYRRFDEEILSRTGTANGAQFTVRAILHIVAGHAQHHLNVLAERYAG
jgi:hypothetical protein